jgi:GTPase SAR1 family protein
MDLRDYERVKFELAEILRAVPYQAERTGQLRELFARLAEDRFNLVVVGRFSRGKTSLMNALLGMDRLPTGVVPLTSVITTVGYGSEERVTLHYPGASLVTDIRLDQLPDYITERGNPGNRRGVSIAEAQLPAAILRRGFDFVDTPGLGSSIAENTRTTEASCAKPTPLCW